MRSPLIEVANHSNNLKTISRHRVSAYLQAGNRAETFQSTLSPSEQNHVASIRGILLSPDFARIIDSGRLTFAMIRPQLELGKRDGTDEELAQQIGQRIRSHFDVILDLPWPVSSEAFTRFYGHVQEKLMSINKKAPDGTDSNVWEIFHKNGTEGATSLMILDAKKTQKQTGHQAWQLWRGFIGATNPDVALAGTLRRDYGSDYNNIAHGSDSLTSVKTDINWAAQQLGKNTS